MLRNLALLLCVFCSLVVTGAAQAAEVGETVLAYWQQGNAYFIATLVEKTAAGNMVVFEDGDTAVVADAKLRKYDLKADSPVIARWSDGNYYKGKIGKVVGRAFYIHYDDGDKGWAPAAWIAVE